MLQIAKKEKLCQRLAEELMLAASGEGNAVKKREMYTKWQNLIKLLHILQDNHLLIIIKLIKIFKINKIYG